MKGWEEEGVLFLFVGNYPSRHPLAVCEEIHWHPKLFKAHSHLQPLGALHHPSQLMDLATQMRWSSRMEAWWRSRWRP